MLFNLIACFKFLERLNASVIQRQPSDRRSDVNTNLPHYRRKGNMSLHNPASNPNDILQNSFHGSETSSGNLSMASSSTPTPTLVNGSVAVVGSIVLDHSLGNSNHNFSPSCPNNIVNANAGGGIGAVEIRNNQHSGSFDIHQCDLSVLDSGGAKNIK